MLQIAVSEDWDQYRLINSSLANCFKTMRKDQREKGIRLSILVEHIRWVSYNEKHIRWKRDLCISMSSYNEKHWKTNSLETGFLYINELQWEKWKMIKTTL